MSNSTEARPPDPTTLVLTAAPLVRFAPNCPLPKAIVWPPKTRTAQASGQHNSTAYQHSSAAGAAADSMPEVSPSPTGPAPPGDSIILEEEIDPNYVPSQDEIDEYAKWLGMDLQQDKDLQWIAREGLKAPLPEHWKPCKTTDTDEIYYFNFSSGESTWDHPCDEYYRTLYEVPPRRPPSLDAVDAFIHAGAAQEEGQRPQKFVVRSRRPAMRLVAISR